MEGEIGVTGMFEIEIILEQLLVLIWSRALPRAGEAEEVRHKFLG